MNTTVTETCSCGATFTVASNTTGVVGMYAAEWRESHKHAESVGICGDQPPPLRWPDRVDRISQPRPYCVLKAGHAGLHGDEQGAHWAEMHTEGDA